MSPTSASSQAKSSVSSPPPNRFELGVLIVADNHEAAEIETILHGAGYLKLASTEVGSEAIQRNRDDDFALILLSDGLADMDAFDAMKEFIRTAERAFGVVYLTDATSTIAAMRFFRFDARSRLVDAADVIWKPIDEHLLLDITRAQILKTMARRVARVW